MDKYIKDVVNDMQRREESEFKAELEACIRAIANLQKEKVQVEKRLILAKEKFRELKLEATNFTELLI